MRAIFKSFSAVLAAAALFFLLFVPQVLNKSLLFEGAESYIFYTHSQSSNAQITLADAEQAPRVKLFLGELTGESAVYGDAASAFAQVKRYGGKLRFKESAADVANYYYYASSLGGGVELCGFLVNLHVAVRGGRASIGSPVIFGGY